ncbi:UNVERIFIED_CONTAM: Anaphase-promoting complex subunit 7 [Siphonaria sp. JEL0065]|nr:Anaphase-promoting complex subunit 7 [Siphonaria sp. JEL0065]
MTAPDTRQLLAHGTALLSVGLKESAALVASLGLALDANNASLLALAAKAAPTKAEAKAVLLKLIASELEFESESVRKDAIRALASLAETKQDAKTTLSLFNWPLLEFNLNDCVLFTRLAVMANQQASGNLKLVLYRTIQLEPLALDAYKHLIRFFGVNVDDVLLRHLSHSSVLKNWVKLILDAFVLETKCCFLGAAEKLVGAAGVLALKKRNGKDDADTVKVLGVELERAVCLVKEGLWLDAKTAFEGIRSNHPYTVKHMDQYARVLVSCHNGGAGTIGASRVCSSGGTGDLKSGTLFELNRLATHMLDVTDTVPEPWIVLARYCELKGDTDRAMHLVEKSLLLDESHTESHLLKGSLLLTQNKPHDAIISFRHAHAHAPSLESYRGLMECYIACKRTKEALSIAKEAIQRMPNSARAVVLVGCVFSHMPDRKMQANSAFAKALHMDPTCTEALYALASSLINDSQHMQAVHLLQENLVHVNNQVIHTRLGDVYTVMKEYEKAMEHYNIALRIDEGWEGARVGFERVEKLVGGDGDGEEGDQSMEEED